MRTVVAYESMYGNTRQLAEAIAEGAQRVGDVTVLAVAELRRTSLSEVDLLIVGGPTHVHSMSRASTRRAAVSAAAKSTPPLRVEPDAEEFGLREWFATAPALPKRAATFDTRMPGPVVFTGSAAKHFARKLRQRNVDLVLRPTSFSVGRDNRLVKGQIADARKWGERAAQRALDAMNSAR